MFLLPERFLTSFGMTQKETFARGSDYKIYSAESRLTFEGAKWEDDEIAYGDWGIKAESEDRLKLSFVRLENCI